MGLNRQVYLEQICERALFQTCEKISWIWGRRARLPRSASRNRLRFHLGFRRICTASCPAHPGCRAPRWPEKMRRRGSAMEVAAISEAERKLVQRIVQLADKLPEESQKQVLAYAQKMDQGGQHGHTDTASDVHADAGVDQIPAF